MKYFTIFSLGLVLGLKWMTFKVEVTPISPKYIVERSNILCYEKRRK